MSIKNRKFLDFFEYFQAFLRETLKKPIYPQKSSRILSNPQFFKIRKYFTKLTMKIGIFIAWKYQFPGNILRQNLYFQCKSFYR